LKLKTFYFISCIVVLLSLAIFVAPQYLIVSDTPVKSDAVVLFLGGEKGTREKKANQLIRDGFADYLIIPARGQVQKRSPDGKLIKIDLPLTPKTSNLKPFFEDTHQENLIARDMMERLGISSAILVSSPYHMRRIRLIAERVFGERATVCYVPTRYETPSDGFWLFNNYDRKFVLTEYAKITWFVLYSPFV
jgi:uncharacterized SAM-binding protein YcdF (DUF218 family)